MKEAESIVGMYASIWGGKNLKHMVFIYGRVNDTTFIVQAINMLLGEPNVCKVVNVADMKDWLFYPTRELAENCYDDYNKHMENRYNFTY